jgi:O-methyltransferase domain/Dimerisation domain
MTHGSFSSATQEPAPTEANANAEVMMQMIYGFAVSQIVRTFADYSIADDLAQGPKTAAEIASRHAASEEAMVRLMRAGIPLGLVTVDAEHVFSSTPLLRTIEEGTPGSLRGLARLLPAKGHWLPWGDLPEAVRTGKEQASHSLGMSIFEYLEQAPDEHSSFVQAMTDISDTVGQQLVRVIETKSISIAADIGGASGALIRAMMAENPDLRGIVFDLPSSIAKTTASLVESDHQGRLSFVAGDFFQGVPENVDLYLLKYVLHDWDDDSCIRILKSCVKAMHHGSRIVVMEMVIADKDNAARSLLQDLNMFVVAGGRERTHSEFTRIFGAAGLRLTGTKMVQSPLGPTTVMEFAAA